MTPQLAVATAGIRVPSSLPVALVVAALLVAASVRVARALGDGEARPAIGRLALWCAVLHLACAPLQIFVVDHVYHGVADWLRYDHQGALLAANFRSGHFTTAGTGIDRILGDGSVSIAAGVVMTVVGADQLAAFLVFAWLAFVGITLFYRAFRVTFPDADRLRYARLVFFLPSLLFWTADVSKEAIMTLSLGAAALGMAKVLARQRGGYPLVVAGTALGLAVRPDELILLLGGFAVAMVFRPRAQSAVGARRAGSLVFVVAVVAVTGLFTARFLHAAGGAGVSGTLTKVSANNQGAGVGFGSSNVPYSSNPLWYPRDVYEVLFNPLPVTAHSLSQLVAAAENTVIVVVVLSSLRRLRLVLRVGLQRPYVLLALIYSLTFLYAFAALGNLGLITRERTLLLPMLLVLLAVPLAPPGVPPYEWERRRARRGQRREPDGRPAGVAADPGAGTAAGGGAWSADGMGWTTGAMEPARWGTGATAPAAWAPERWETARPDGGWRPATAPPPPPP